MFTNKEIAEFIGIIMEGGDETVSHCGLKIRQAKADGLIGTTARVVFVTGVGKKFHRDHCGW